MTCRRFSPALCFIAITLCGTLAAQDDDPAAGQSRSISELRAAALQTLQAGDTKAALLAADAILKHAQKDDARSLRLAGDIYLRCGKCERAVQLFDRYLELVPQAMPGLWQRGIALYFVGDFGRGVKQFEEHRVVNPHDVENAAWHFLCVAKADSFERAQQVVLPAPNDPRPPMKQVLAMLTTGNTEAVQEMVRSLPEGSSRRDSAAFYGDFYLGLYADASGDQKKAARLLARSASGAPHHYMGDVARVYAQFLQDKTKQDLPE